MTTEQKKLKYKMYNQKYRLRQKSYVKKRVFKRLMNSANWWYKNGIITAFDLWKIAKKQKLKCALSGIKLTPENTSLDHIIPKSKGGINTPSNIRLVLKSINTTRQTMTDAEFIELCESVVNHARGGSKNLSAGGTTPVV